MKRTSEAVQDGLLSVEVGGLLERQYQPTDYHRIEQFQTTRFNGKNWEMLGGIVGFSAVSGISVHEGW